ncbi:hypothetical protein C5C95_06260 [Rathayibacter sp. AY1B7]|uniref:right-handed parallel beta-helix repeat-containing protein n=1 Tax=Rathayibacter sp. AY1B7 TaxID=2080532 RepID=UPI000CE81F7D|nr:right-handed parallel beta-helix repeat-containing protein [Rathayibacter sp. AY1B7]PPH99743.1 hypothetical protein C5C95_06260 [Rathayibacter sp. AY1B7]
MTAMTPLGDMQAVSDGTAAALIRKDGTETQQAVDERIAPVAAAAIASDETVRAAATTAVGVEVEARNLLSADDERLPEAVISDWVYVETDEAGYISRGVDQSGATWIKLHPEVKFPAFATMKPGSDFAHALIDPENRVSELAVGFDGRFIPQSKARFGTAAQVDVRDVLPVGVPFPNDGVADATAVMKTALLKARDLAAFVGPVQVNVPPGRYRITGRLPLYSKVGIRGYSRGETVFLPEGGQAFIYQAYTGSTTSPDQFLDDVRFNDFTVDGAAQTQEIDAATGLGMGYTTRVKGFYATFLRRAVWENVTVRNTWSTGFGVDHLQDSYFVNCRAFNCGRGVAASGITDKHTVSGASGFGYGTGGFAWESVTYLNCTANDNALFGFFLEKQTSAVIPSPNWPIGLRIIGCWASGNWGGFRDCGTGGAIIANSHFVGNEVGMWWEKTVLITAAGRNGTVSGCQVLNNTAEGIRVDTASNGPYRITGNRIAGNKGAGVRFSPDCGVIDAWTVDANVIEDNGSSGVLVQSVDQARRLLIARNVIRDNGREVTAEHRDGITFASTAAASLLTVRDNEVYGLHAAMQQNGVRLSGTNTDAGTVIKGNDLRGNAVAALANTRTATAGFITDNLGVTA